MVEWPKARDFIDDIHRARVCALIMRSRVGEQDHVLDFVALVGFVLGIEDVEYVGKLEELQLFDARFLVACVFCFVVLATVLWHREQEVRLYC